MAQRCVQITLRNGEMICVRLPDLKSTIPPEEWVMGIDATLAHDLWTYGTISAVADLRMSPELKRHVEPALKAMERSLAARMPEGMALHTHG